MDAETIEESYVWACSWLSQNRLPRGGLDSLMSVINQENAPTDQSNQGNSSSEIFSPKLTLVCVELTKPASTMEQEVFGLIWL